MPNYRPPPIRVTYKTKDSQLTHGFSIASATLFDPEPKEHHLKARNKTSSYGRYTTKETDILQDISVKDSKPFFVSLLDMSAFVSNPNSGQTPQKLNITQRNQRTDRLFSPLKAKNTARYSSLMSQTSNSRNISREYSEDVKYTQQSYKYPAFAYRNSKPNHLRYYKYLQKKQRSYPEKSTALTPILPETPSLDANLTQLTYKTVENSSQELSKFKEISKQELNVEQQLEADSLATLQKHNTTDVKSFSKQNQHYKGFKRTKVFEKRQVDRIKEVNIHDIELPSFQTANEFNTDAATQTFSTKQALNSFKIKKKTNLKKEKPNDSKLYNLNRYISTSPQSKSYKTDNEVTINNSIIQ